MVIDNLTYSLPEINYVKSETIKKQIVLANSFSSDMKHFIGWITRFNGFYDKTAAFTIDAAGVVYEHFNPIYMGNFFQNQEQSKKSIVILIENEGWLTKIEEKGEFINWMGNIYNKPDLVVEKKWRNHSHWAPYNEAQLNSAVQLVDRLCKEFYIPKVAIPNNTKIEDIDNFDGVIYKSNIEKYYTDLSPAWDCETFKYKLENNEKERSNK